MLDNLTEKFIKRKKKPTHIKEWQIPESDENGQWWWGYQKVRMIVLPDQERLKKEFIEKYKMKS